MTDRPFSVSSLADRWGRFLCIAFGIHSAKVVSWVPTRHLYFIVHYRCTRCGFEKDGLSLVEPTGPDWKL